MNTEPGGKNEEFSPFINVMFWITKFELYSGQTNFFSFSLYYENWIGNRTLRYVCNHSLVNEFPKTAKFWGKLMCCIIFEHAWGAQRSKKDSTIVYSLLSQFSRNLN